MLDNEPGEQSQVAVDMPHSKGSRIAAVGTLFNEVWDTLQGKSAKPGSAVERQMQRFVTSLGADNFERRERTRELLEEAGTLAIPILRRAVRDPDLQTRRTGEQLLEKLLDERFPPYTSLADWRRSLRDPDAEIPPVPAIVQLSHRLTPPQIEQQQNLVNNFQTALAEAKNRNWAQNLRNRLEDWSEGLGELAKIRGEAEDIVSLDFAGKRVSNALIADLENFPNLLTLELSNCAGLTPENLRTLGQNHPNMAALSLGATGVNDRGLRWAATMRNLESVSLPECTEVTDAGIEHLAQALTPTLRRLDLSGTAASDVIMRTVGRLPKLRELSLDHTAISDAGVLQLRNRDLGYLSLRDTKVTDNGLRNLPSNLGILDLGDTAVTGAGLPELKHLTHLVLGRSKVSNLDFLERLPKLETLDLRGTQVDDSQIERLVAAGKRAPLRIIDLRETKVTANGVARLQQELGNDVKIDSDFTRRR
jgi:hypothetical protein